MIPESGRKSAFSARCGYIGRRTLDSHAVSYTHLDVYKRQPVDRLEMLVAKEMWPMPSYGDLLFEV